MSKREPPNTSATVIRLTHSIADVAEISGVGRSFLYEQIKLGRLVIKKAGRRSLVMDADLKSWLATLPTKIA
ncbi:helix-turn-helix domain-containing protein [Bradyrhizobium barranii subsp. barranii]|uniref:DNA-binding protein n=1 Tax=Bradyrhizobium barranii subsp. barranii TaxID=2823807 RepID=A0A7Z0QD72_9BRAD|nr:helix-turn-helix domain-containing protein [Bradyrhizobium barranii]UGX92328.1 helix-turn-helix domain-containing protein [Bradyrhizobium barranii subsp. barranii]